MTVNEVVQPEGESVEKKAGIPTWVWVVGALLVVALVVLAFLAFSKPSTPPDDSWEKVQAAGVLSVATSADYPPFAYQNQDYMIDGFDPALIREIGSKLGVQVQITDYAFEGLGSALDVGQADVAIAAISQTPERSAAVDFSNVYYVGKDGILARTDSGIEHISQVSQISGKRVGVQKRSVYETWAQKYLVDAGVIPQAMLFAYAKPEHAVGDLKLGRLDLVIMDLQPAIRTLSDADLSLVGEGMSQQLLAIALPKGAHTLKAKIDQALLALQNEGKVNQLAQTYLGLRPEDLIPPPTPEPTETPCDDAMLFVEDLNYDDKDLTEFPVLDPGKTFQKGWRIKNTGTCTWTNAYFIKYVNGKDPAAQMGGQPTAIKGEVKANAAYDMYVDLTAPAQPGKYVGYWQMHNAAGVPFGQTIWVAIEVRNTDPSKPTATHTPETSPTPTLEPSPQPTATQEPTATEAPPEPTATAVPPEPTATEEPGADLRDTTWVLEGLLLKIEDQELAEPIKDVDVELVFNEKGLFEGKAGCNTVTGRYVTNGTEIVFRDLLVTRLTCQTPPGIMDQEVLFLKWLEEAEEYRINDKEQLEFTVKVIENNVEVEKILLQFYDLTIGPTR